MGESVCLVRSFSQPASCETNEVVPHRVLSESVSFGRFASESLQWEKWSAFTQNRYLEEVERFTKPGSVAQKKAFFEAHFKNRAAGRATQTKIEEVNVENSDEIVCEVRKDNLIDSEVPPVVNNGMTIDEVRHEEVDNAVMDYVAPSVSVIDETIDVQTGEVEVTTVENFTSMAVPEDEENSTSLRKKRRSSSSGSKTCARSSKLEPFFVKRPDLSLRKTRNEPLPSSKRSISVSKNQNRSSVNPFHMTISCAPSGNTDKNLVKIPKMASRSTTIAKGAGISDNKERSGPSSVHMSLNFASSARQTTKTPPINLGRNSTIQETTSTAKSSVFPNENKPAGASKSRKRPLPLTAKEGSNVAKCSTSASAFRLPELFPPNIRLSEHKRKNLTKGSSVTCRIPKTVQKQPSVDDNLSNHTRTRAKSFTVSSPFNFCSDERAEKRKEFFKKLEEKNKKEDVVKEQPGFKESLRSLTSPRFSRNQTPGKENINKSHQPPNKVVSVKTINTSNASMEKYKRCKIHNSSRPQTYKKTQENSSPNILQN